MGLQNRADFKQHSHQGKPSLGGEAFSTGALTQWCLYLPLKPGSEEGKLYRSNGTLFRRMLEELR